MNNNAPFIVKPAVGTLISLYVYLFWLVLAAVFSFIAFLTVSGSERFFSIAFFLLMVAFAITTGMSIVRFRRRTSSMLTFDGTILRRTPKAPAAVEQVDLTSLVSITEDTEGTLVPPTPATYVRPAHPAAHSLVLRDAAGSSLTLQLESFNQANRRKVVALLVPLLSSAGIEQHGDISQALANWTGKPQGDARPARGTNQSLKSFWITIAGIIVMSIVLVMVVNGIHNKACQKLAASGINTTAQVTSLTLIQTGGGRYNHDKTVDTLEQANELQATVLYTIDNTQYTATMYVEYSHSKEALQNVYKEMQTGSMQIRYTPEHPDKPRPASEFTAGGLGHCQA